jgi:ribosomal protein RSM22 (predicted rRNA methylase)
MLPLEAVAVTRGAQGVIQRAVKEAKLSLPDLRQVIRPPNNPDSSGSRQHGSGEACRLHHSGSRASPVISNEIRELAAAITAAPLSLASNVFVMSELRRCRPGFQPRSMLDFGAGTAVSVSAAARVFREYSPGSDVSNSDRLSRRDQAAGFSARDQAEPSGHSDPRLGERRGRAQADWIPSGCTMLESVVLVDQAPALRRLGKDILKEDEFLRNSESLDVKAARSLRDVRGPTLGGGFDIVSASCALSEVANSDSQRTLEPGMALVDPKQLRERRLKSVVLSLWKVVNPGGFLVIVEDGTLPGFETVVVARELLLNHNHRTTRQGSGEKLNADKNVLEISTTNAKVVAPCLHSQSCPLEGNASRSRVCRFAQRLNRPPYLRTAIPLANGFEDQYFSFVVVEKCYPAPICSDSQVPEEISDARLHDEAVAGDCVSNTGWGRLIRAPSRKEKHIILDACTANGTLERRVVSRKNAPDGMYRTARRARWGDVWPVAPPNAPQDVKFG